MPSLSSVLQRVTNGALRQAQAVGDRHPGVARGWYRVAAHFTPFVLTSLRQNRLVAEHALTRLEWGRGRRRAALNHGWTWYVGLRTALGSEHPSTGLAGLQLALMHQAAGADAMAYGLFHACLPTLERRGPAGDWSRLWALSSLAEVATRLAQHPTPDQPNAVTWGGTATIWRAARDLALALQLDDYPTSEIRRFRHTPADVVPRPIVDLAGVPFYAHLLQGYIVAARQAGDIEAASAATLELDLFRSRIVGPESARDWYAW